MKKLCNPLCFIYEKEDINQLIMVYNDIISYIKNPSIKNELTNKYYYSIPASVDYLVKCTINYLNYPENVCKDPRQSKEALDILEKFEDPNIQKAYYEIVDDFNNREPRYCCPDYYY